MKPILLLLFLILPSLVQQQPLVVELGPEVYSTIPRSNGYKWIVRGNLYAAGTWTPPPGQPLPRGACEPADGVAPIGQYLIVGESGNTGDHTALYVVRLNSQQYLFTGRTEYYEDASGAPGSTLFPAAKLVEGVATVPDPPISAELIPRSRQCFGGQLRLFTDP